MKNNILFFIIVCMISCKCYSQQNFDDVTYTLEDLHNMKTIVNSNLTDTNYSLKYYKILFHIVRQTDGTINNDFNVNENISKAILYMNSKFIDANVQFYVCDLHYIDDDRFYNFDISNDQNLIMDTYNQDDAINIYLFNTMYDEIKGDMWGYTYMPFTATQGKNIIALRYSTFEELSTITHEMGHFFGLPHTHNDFSNQVDEFVDGSNCQTAGDCFCDTPADPKMDFANDVNEDCEYILNKVDAHGDIYEPATDLIMSYARHKCRTRFSLEQLLHINIIANQPVRTSFSHMIELNNEEIMETQIISEDVVIMRETNVKSGAQITINPCAFVIFDENIEVELGANLEVVIN